MCHVLVVALNLINLAFMISARPLLPPCSVLEDMLLLHIQHALTFKIYAVFPRGEAMFLVRFSQITQIFAQINWCL
jgi:hypothetical protein